MLKHLEQPGAAAAVEVAVIKAIPHLKGMSAGQMGMSTSDGGDMVASFI